MNQIRNVIFDLGVVLINLDPAECIRRFRHLGIEDIEQRFVDAQHSGIFHAFEKGEISVPEFFESIRTLADRPLTDDQIRNAWLGMLKEIPSYKLDLLLNLRNHYNVFLLSNTNELHWDFCSQNVFNYKGYQADDFFRKIWLSNEIHLLKPSEEIFRFILKDANLNPDETLFLDDLQANCQTARKLGIRTYTPVAEEDWSFIFENNRLNSIRLDHESKHH